MTDFDAAVVRTGAVRPGLRWLYLLSWPSRRLAESWVNTTARTRLVVKLVVLVVCTATAYNYSLWTLLQLANLQTPLAYASLVPLIALGIAALRASQTRGEAMPSNRHADYLVGIPLILAATAIDLVLPARLSVMFWAWRVDLFSMPLYVAGLIVLLFGVAALRRQRLALAFLFLSWPLLWNEPLLSVLNAVTHATLSALDGVLKVVHLATPAPGTTATFQIAHHGTKFALSIISACSGIDGVAGFVFVGCAFGAMVEGPRLKKAAWLAIGMIVIWTMNLVRILFLFWAGGKFGEGTAVNVLHPYAGLVTFSLGVAVMLALLPVIGLSISVPSKASRSTSSPVSDLPPAALGKLVPALVVGLVTCIILGATNLNLRLYNPASSVAAEPQLVAMTGAGSQLSSPKGWTRNYVTQFSWAQPLFGEDSSWYRYSYQPSSAAAGSPTTPVTADVVNATALSPFSAYGVVQTYQLRGYHLQDFARVSVGRKVVAQTLSYTSATAGTWSFLYWIAPVTNATSTHFERIVLFLRNAQVPARDPLSVSDSFQNVSGSLNLETPEGRSLAETRAYLTRFAQELVGVQERQSATTNVADLDSPIERTRASTPR
jgi:exosortase/archaeosortase family protein